MKYNKQILLSSIVVMLLMTCQAMPKNLRTALENLTQNFENVYESFNVTINFQLQRIKNESHQNYSTRHIDYPVVDLSNDRFKNSRTYYQSFANLKPTKQDFDTFITLLVQDVQQAREQEIQNHLLQTIKYALTKWCTESLQHRTQPKHDEHFDFVINTEINGLLTRHNTSESRVVKYTDYPVFELQKHQFKQSYDFYKSLYSLKSISEQNQDAFSKVILQDLVHARSSDIHNYLEEAVRSAVTSWATESKDHRNNKENFDIEINIAVAKLKNQSGDTYSNRFIDYPVFRLQDNNFTHSVDVFNNVTGNSTSVSSIQKQELIEVVVADLQRARQTEINNQLTQAITQGVKDWINSQKKSDFNALVNSIVK